MPFTRVSCAIFAGALAQASLFPGVGAQAQSFSDALQHASQCTLQYTANTRSQTAVAMIRSACSDLYNPVGLSTGTRQAYDNCLLQYLSGAQSDAAAAQIQQSCANIYPRF